MSKIYIGCDDAAVDFKNAIKNEMDAEGCEVIDVGVSSMGEHTYYPYIAQRLCEKIQQAPHELRGILICGTGIGMCICANKFKGIRAAVVHDAFVGERSRLSNDCNVICLGSRVIGLESAKTLVRQWLPLGHVSGASVSKVDAIYELERENFK